MTTTAKPDDEHAGETAWQRADRILRMPFPPEQISKLPKITCRPCLDSSYGSCGPQHPKQRCSACNGVLTRAHIDLDYVGHADVTYRLLEADSQWSWEPLAWDPDGLPLIKDGCLWIKLTVAGVTRIGVGDAGANGRRKSAGDTAKEMIGDAIRNAAMRFGVALQLWSKIDRTAEQDDSTDAHAVREPTPARKAPGEPETSVRPSDIQPDTSAPPDLDPAKRAVLEAYAVDIASADMNRLKLLRTELKDLGDDALKTPLFVGGHRYTLLGQINARKAELEKEVEAGT